MDILSRPAEEFENDQSVEMLWATKAYDHAEVYFNLICSVDPRFLQLTRIDDEIYKTFRDTFPSLDLKVIREDELKSTKEKLKWRPYCERFKDKIDDYSFGTLLRSDSEKDYSEENTMLVTRIQFYAIEIARNREGVNSNLRKLYFDKFKAEEEQ